MSILWGLGLSALFKKVCKGRNCIVYSAHNPREIEKNIYKHNEKCYNYKTQITECNNEPIEHITIQKKS